MAEKGRSQSKKLTPSQIEAVENKVFELAEVIVSANYFVVDVIMELERERWYLRIYLDHPNPAIRITLDDCKDISEALEPMIDENVPQLLDFPYSLEVSSPGLFRKLGKPREFDFYAHRRVEITQKGLKPFIAYLDSFDREHQEVLYRLTADEATELHRLSWTPKEVKVCLSPDLTEKIDIKEVPRRITRYD